MSLSPGTREYLNSSFVERHIKERSICCIQYKGTFRVIQPYMLGKTEKQGMVCHAYQRADRVPANVAMVPASDNDEGWRFFYLNKFEGLISMEVMPGEFKWVDPPDLQKTEYQKPKFVTEIIALSPRTP